MDDKEILDRMDAIASRIEGSVAKISERLVKVEINLNTDDKRLNSMHSRQRKMEAEQVATKIRIAYVAGAAAVGTVVVSRLFDVGLSFLKTTLGGG